MIRLPDEEEVVRFKQTFAEKYTIPSNFFCVADGLELHLEQPGDYIIQNMFYNGWNHDHYVSNVFVFAPNGGVIACSLNAPGAMQDSTVAE